MYFALSNAIFIGGANGKMDAFFWGFLSFIIYWPFSHVTGEIWQMIEGIPPSVDNTHAVFLGLSRAQWLIYSLDVLAGTAWWFTLSLCVSKIRTWTSDAVE
jgi:hypothetical protein